MSDITEGQLKVLDAEEVAALAQQMLQRLREQDAALQQRKWQIAQRGDQLQRNEHELRHKGAKTEAISAEQRRLFEETCAEDEATLQAQIDQARARQPAAGDDKKPKPKPRREPPPDHLRRVVYRHEPDEIHCPSEGCGAPMTRIGEDLSEQLDIVPAEFGLG